MSSMEAMLVEQFGPFMDIDELASLLKIKRQSMYQNIYHGRLDIPHAKLGKKYWVRLSATVTDDADETTKKRAKSINDRLVGYVYEVKEEVGKKLACEHVNLLEGAGVKACA